MPIIHKKGSSMSFHKVYRESGGSDSMLLSGARLLSNIGSWPIKLNFIKEWRDFDILPAASKCNATMHV